MRNVIPIFFLLLALSFFSCSKNEGETGNNDNGNNVSFENSAINVDEDGGTVTVLAVLSGDVEGGFTVDYATADDSANQDEDYVATNGTLAFAGNNGESRRITIDIVDNIAAEPEETFTITLSNPSIDSVRIGSADRAIVTINDNDGNNATSNNVSFDRSTVNVDENAGTITLSAVLSGNVAGGFTIDYATNDDSARRNEDYVETRGTINFDGNDGEQQQITIDIIDNNTVEPDETFSVTLSNPSTNDVRIGSINTTSISINDIVNREYMFRPLGFASNDYFVNTNFDNINVEIAYVTGFRPTQAAIDNLTGFFEEFTFKTNINYVFNELPSPNMDALSFDMIAEMEVENRTLFNDGRDLTVYIYFADAPSDNDEPDEGLVTLGAVYRSTSMVIFQSTLNQFGTSPARSEAVETATLQHEFGHLFGLVNINLPPINDHEDRNASGHCNVDGCLMRAVLQLGGVAKGAIHHDLHKKGCQVSKDAFLDDIDSRIAKGLANTAVFDRECRLDIESNGARVTSTAFAMGLKGY